VLNLIVKLEGIDTALGDFKLCLAVIDGEVYIAVLLAEMLHSEDIVVVGIYNLTAVYISVTVRFGVLVGLGNAPFEVVFEIHNKVFDFGLGDVRGDR